MALRTERTEPPCGLVLLVSTDEVTKVLAVLRSGRGCGTHRPAHQLAVGLTVRGRGRLSG